MTASNRAESQSAARLTGRRARGGRASLSHADPTSALAQRRPGARVHATWSAYGARCRRGPSGACFPRAPLPRVAAGHPWCSLVGATDTAGAHRPRAQQPQRAPLRRLSSASCAEAGALAHPRFPHRISPFERLVLRIPTDFVLFTTHRVESGFPRLHRRPHAVVYPVCIDASATRLPPRRQDVRELYGLPEAR